MVSASGVSRPEFKPGAPWLVLPGETPESAQLVSMADPRIAAVRAPAPAMRDHVILGSSCGWLVTADDAARMRLVDPCTGEQRDLPHIATFPFLDENRGDDAGRCTWYCLHVEPFLQVRFAGGPPYDDHWGPLRPRTCSFTGAQMRQWFYRKVVLSGSPAAGGSYAAMLLLERDLGAPAFATAEHPSWKVAPSRDGVEDAIHHSGKFYSISYSGTVETWEHDAVSGEFTSQVVMTSRLANESDHKQHRKYLAAAPDGRLMVVLKDAKEIEVEQRYSSRQRSWTCSFKVQVLDEATMRWEEAADVGDVALFVGVNSSLCVSTAEHPRLEAGSVYFTDDELGQALLRKDDKGNEYFFGDGEETRRRRNAGVYSLKHGTVQKIDDPLEKEYEISWPPPAWCMPSVTPTHDRKLASDMLKENKSRHQTRALRQQLNSYQIQNPI